MNVEEFREYCLSLPGVSEKMPFPNVADRYSRDVLCFYVGDKWFCFVNIEVFDFCCIKCRPEESTELRARYEGVKPGWHMNKKYWNSVYFNQDVPDSIIRELVARSYRLGVESLPKRERERYTRGLSQYKSGGSKIVSLSAVWLRRMSPTSFNRVKLMTPAVFFLSCFISSYSWSYCLQLKAKLP